ncbi:signal recognition particle subunit SRP72 [Thrips palmi]|uniref:Signal recognition particle subunit SRP72 n=1 Tax=Thrips palmi TaxID=161013 RepID=A0A6P8YEW6_THRPL|nr:signal recognition particle subunit SRP72 [Thrips palmi]
MSSAKEANLSALYAELNKFGQNGEYERALKAANKILSSQADEEKAFHCKIVSLIQLSKFNDALGFISKNPKLSSDLTFEKAYCQYRLNQPQEALKTVNSEQQLSVKLKELKAQILYRLEQYEECFDVYRDIIKNTEDDYEDERETNLSAVLANLCIEGSEKELPALRETTYELVYNTACQLIGRQQYIEAEKKLRLSEKMCREMLEEDGSTEDEIEEELAIIRVQLAYCLQLQGREKEAQGIYTAALKRKPDDISLVAIASNNSVAINKDQNVFDSKKKMKSASSDGLEHKLTSRQRKNIAVNQCLMLLYTNQGDQCQKQCELVSRLYPDLTADLSLVRATQLARDGRAREAAAILEKAASSSPTQELEMKLASVQLLLAQGDRKEACNILRNLGDSTFKPGIVSALVTLYLADNNREGASNILRDAVEWYKRSKDKGDLRLLWRQAADLNMRSGAPNIAAQSLEELLKLNPDSTKTLAQLVIAYAQFDPAKATALSKKLPNLDYQGQDVDALESSNWIMGTKVIKKATKVEPSPGSKAGTPGDELLQKKLKKKKKRKGKLPKPYESGVLPDPNPDRWLPKHERPGYRKKRVDRRFRDAAIGKGTQGTAAGASDMYDMSKVSNQSKASPAATSPIVEPGPRQQQRKVQQKGKKKGKGK